MNIAIFVVASVIGAIWLRIKSGDLPCCNRDCNQGRKCDEKCKD